MFFDAARNLIAIYARYTATPVRNGGCTPGLPYTLALRSRGKPAGNEGVGCSDIDGTDAPAPSGEWVQGTGFQQISNVLKGPAFTIRLAN